MRLLVANNIFDLPFLRQTQNTTASSPVLLLLRATAISRLKKSLGDGENAVVRACEFTGLRDDQTTKRRPPQVLRLSLFAFVGHAVGLARCVSWVAVGFPTRANRRVQCPNL